mmetsp:Transcript_140888/g.449613  ORF Transcript_140888/g.449613 Transcript_140888/m.449613 type:complete len:173 (+) Transcript_140888:1966-2484(+)
MGGEACHNNVLALLWSSLGRCSVCHPQGPFRSPPALLVASAAAMHFNIGVLPARMSIAISAERAELQDTRPPLPLAADIAILSTGRGRYLAELSSQPLRLTRGIGSWSAWTVVGLLVAKLLNLLWCLRVVHGAHLHLSSRCMAVQLCCACSTHALSTHRLFQLSTGRPLVVR